MEGRAGERDVGGRSVHELRELVEPLTRPAGDDPEGEEVVPSGVVLGVRYPALLANFAGGGPGWIGPDRVVDPDRQVVDVGEDGGEGCRRRLAIVTAGSGQYVGERKGGFVASLLYDDYFIAELCRMISHWCRRGGRKVHRAPPSRRGRGTLDADMS
jgi:hypothetical protein